MEHIMPKAKSTSKSTIKKTRAIRKPRTLKDKSLPPYPPKNTGPKVYSFPKECYVLIKKIGKTEEVFTYSENKQGLQNLCDSYNAQSNKAKYYIVKQSYT